MVQHIVKILAEYQKVKHSQLITFINVWILWGINTKVKG